jgi:hypothetical protein
VEEDAEQVEREDYSWIMLKKIQTVWLSKGSLQNKR